MFSNVILYTDNLCNCSLYFYVYIMYVACVYQCINLNYDDNIDASIFWRCDFNDSEHTHTQLHVHTIRWAGQRKSISLDGQHWKRFSCIQYIFIVRFLMKILCHHLLNQSGIRVIFIHSSGQFFVASQSRAYLIGCNN